MSTIPPAGVDQYLLYDEKHRKIISKDSLVCVGGSTSQTEQIINRSQDSAPQDDSWTQHSWHKAGTAHTPITPEKGKIKAWKNQPQAKQANKLQKKLEEALATPVQMTKAQSMMQKMGWEGGALGKTGTGIVEPVAPNAAYAMKTRGFGQATHTPDPPSHPPPLKKKKVTIPRKVKHLGKVKKQDLETFQSNVLHQILEFVKNDYDSEIVFDKQLFRNERKHVHYLVNEVVNENDVASLGCLALMDIVGEIRRHNHYVLCTESEGKAPNRYLCLFKEAPEHVYLVTPKDLREETEDVHELDEESETNISNNENRDDIKKESKDTHNHNELGIESQNSDRTVDSSHSLVRESESKDINVRELKDNDGITKLVKLNDNTTCATTSESNALLKINTVIDKSENEVNSKKNIKESNIILNENISTESKDSNTSNDFLRAIEKNIQENKESENDQKLDVTGKLIEYFKEFAEGEDYSELRFLGSFTREEMDSINNLVSSVYYHVNHDEDKVEKLYAEVLKGLNEERYIFEVKEDTNGSPVIHKTDRHQGKRRNTKSHVFFDTEECE